MRRKSCNRTTATPKTESIAWDGHDTPRSERFKDRYYAVQDGLAESRHVFLQHNGLPARFRDHRPGAFVVMELGFGTGLSFLATWQAWRALDPRSRSRPLRLHFMAVEQFPLSERDMHRALSHWPELGTLQQRLLANWPERPCDYLHVVLAPDVTLSVFFDDVLATLSRLDPGRDGMVDSWYLDGFAPARNPDMWSQAVFAQMTRLSRGQARFATFTAAGHVRRGLQSSGFQVHKVRGFMHKREMLCGELTQIPARKLAKPWFAPPKPASINQALVIGAGVAGCAMAWSLAQRGVHVTLIDSNNGPAMGASGNLAGVIYPYLTRDCSIAARWSLAGFDLTCRQLRAFAVGGHALRCALDGVLQLATSSDDVERLRDVADAPHWSQRCLRFLSAEEATEQAGIPIMTPALLIPGAGWLAPVDYCTAMLKAGSSSIETVWNRSVELSYHDDEWHATAAGISLAHAAVAIICTGTLQTPPMPDAAIPLILLRGVVTHLPASRGSSIPRLPLCHQGYVTPAVDGMHCVGATFERNNADGVIHNRDHAKNLQVLSRHVPALARRLAICELDPACMSGRVGWRVSAPDHLPLVGPCPDWQDYRHRFRSLRHGPTHGISAPRYLPGLFLNLAHGARGLTAAALAGEMIAGQVLGEAPILPAELMHAVHPGRFAIRGLIKENGNLASALRYQRPPPRGR